MKKTVNSLVGTLKFTQNSELSPNLVALGGLLKPFKNQPASRQRNSLR